MKIKKIKFIPNILFKLYSRQLIKSFPPYQPIFLNGKIKAGEGRNCFDRWQMIKKEILDFNVKSVVDLGCAEGFYVIQASRELGCFSLGIDADTRRLSVAHNQIISEEIMPAGFMLGYADLEIIEKLPKFDMIILMSVLHHIMYSRGKEYCREFVSRLRTKMEKIMIFEMGQSNEVKNEWAKKLPDMGNDPSKWIADFLISCGFSKVVKIGETDSYKKDKNRTIFRLEK